MIYDFEQMILPITEFRHNMTKILDKLSSPKILMNRDKPQAVLVPYETFKAMEEALEGHMDEILASVAKERVSESEAQYYTHKEFWNDLGVKE